MTTALDPLKIYFKEIRKIPPISKKEFIFLFKKVKKGDSNARRRLVEGNLRLVISIAKRYYNKNINFLDIIEEGNIGLMRAVEKFNPRKKTSFSTYATLWINQAVKRAVQNKEKTIKVPYYVFHKVKMLLKTYENLRFNMGQQPTVDELAKILNISTGEMRSIIRDFEVTQDVSSIDADITDDESLALKDVLMDKSSITPEAQSTNKMREQQVEEVLKRLDGSNKKKNNNLRFVIEHRFGLSGKERITLAEIGKRLHLSRERVRQIEEEAKRKMKNHILRNKNFEIE